MKERIIRIGGIYDTPGVIIESQEGLDTFFPFISGNCISSDFIYKLKELIDLDYIITFKI